MSEVDYNQRLREIEELLHAKRYTACIRECGLIFEAGLRELVQTLVNNLEDAAKRDEIFGAERRIAKANESFRKFGLGQMVGLYTEAKILDKLRSHLEISLQKVRRISWNDVVSLRNAAAHENTGAEIDEGDALQMYYWAKVFLYDTQLMDGPKAQKKTGPLLSAGEITVCPECKRSLQKEWRFCPTCGTAVQAVCLSCGAALAPTFKICPYCEAPTRGAAVSAKIVHEYELLFRGAYLDMIITAQERAMLDQKRLELGLSVEQAEEIEKRCVPANILEYHHLVEGVLVDGIINEYERVFLNKKTEQLKIDPKIAACIEDDVKRAYECP
jgi:RNA polymerase subunit RPABC4/transcription elongation factor Spt4